MSRADNRWSLPLSKEARRAYPDTGAPHEMRAAEAIVHLRRTGTSYRQIVAIMSTLAPADLRAACRGARWHVRTVRSICRRAGLAGRRPLLP